MYPTDSLSNFFLLWLFIFTSNSQENKIVFLVFRMKIDENKQDKNCELNYHDQKIQTLTHDIQKHWTAVSSLLGQLTWMCLASYIRTLYRGHGHIQRIGNTHLRNYYDLKGKDIDVH